MNKANCFLCARFRLGRLRFGSPRAMPKRTAVLKTFMPKPGWLVSISTATMASAVSPKMDVAVDGKKHRTDLPTRPTFMLKSSQAGML